MPACASALAYQQHDPIPRRLAEAATEINGERHQVLIEPHWTLLHVLRNVVGMMGTKENCLEAECGVCTVLLDGKSVNSCILLAAQAAGRSVTPSEENYAYLHNL